MKRYERPHTEQRSHNALLVRRDSDFPQHRSSLAEGDGAIGQSVTGLRTTSSPNRPMQVWQRRSSGVSLHRRRSDPCDRNSPHQVSDCSALMMCHNEASTRIRIRTASRSMSRYGAVTPQVTARQWEGPNFRSPVRPSRWPARLQTRQYVPLSRGRYQWPVNVVGSAQYVAWAL